MRISKTFYRALVSVGFFVLSFQVKAKHLSNSCLLVRLILWLMKSNHFYLNIGGPNLYCFDSPNSKSGIVFTPSLKFKMKKV